MSIYIKAGLGKSGMGTGTGKETGIFRVKEGRGPGTFKEGQGAGCGAVTATGNHRVYVLVNNARGH